MTTITLSPLQWGRLQDLQDVEPLDADDVACMRDLRDVLARHGRLERFALQLAHKHFDIAADEVLVEYSDPVRREQRLHVRSRDGSDLLDAVPTLWSLAEERPRVVCVCAQRAGQGHLGRHEPA